MYTVHKMLIMIVLCSLCLMSGCSKDNEIDQALIDENNDYNNYKKAHDFIGDSAILKEGWFPIEGCTPKPYKQWNFENYGTGYYYISKDNAPYLESMFLKITYISENLALSCNESSDVHYMSASTKVSSGVSSVVMKDHTGVTTRYYKSKDATKPDTIAALDLGGNESNGRNSVYWFGVVDKEHGYITFEIYFTKSDFIPPQMYCKSQILSWIANKDFNIEVVKKLENVRFKYYP